jgi:hypothetical protein
MTLLGRTVCSSCCKYEDYVWVALGNAMKAKQSKANPTTSTHDKSPPHLKAVRADRSSFSTPTMLFFGSARDLDHKRTVCNVKVSLQVTIGGNLGTVAGPEY